MMTSTDEAQRSSVQSWGAMCMCDFLSSLGAGKVDRSYVHTSAIPHIYWYQVQGTYIDKPNGNGMFILLVQTWIHIKKNQTCL